MSIDVGVEVQLSVKYIVNATIMTGKEQYGTSTFEQQQFHKYT